jgi:hypothetical protein
LVDSQAKSRRRLLYTSAALKRTGSELEQN